MVYPVLCWQHGICRCRHLSLKNHFYVSMIMVVSGLSRIGIENSDLAEYQRQRIKNFETALQSNTFYEILPVYDLDAIKDNRIKVSFSDIMNGGSVFYTKEEYVGHLEHLAFLLNTYENFHIKLVEDISESSYMIYVKDERGVIIAKTSAPPIILAVNETNLTAACWDFLRDIIGEKNYQNPNKARETKRLKEYIKRIRVAW